MVFYTLIQSAMHQLDGRRPSSRSIRDYSRLIDIYGDDIIVPVEYTDVVVNYLESYALVVNVNKSFRFSNFRESCGADYYKGIPVNPVYARTVPHDDLRHWKADEIMSWNATADLFYVRGMWHISQTIRDLLSRVVRRTIPRSRSLGSGLAHFSFLFSTDLFYNKDLQGWKQKRLHFNPVKRKDQIDGDELACLNKWGIHIAKRQKGFSKGFSSQNSDHVHTNFGQGTGELSCSSASDSEMVNVEWDLNTHELTQSSMQAAYATYRALRQMRRLLTVPFSMWAPMAQTLAKNLLAEKKLYQQTTA
jgi:hypothetical protein